MGDTTMLRIFLLTLAFALITGHDAEGPSTGQYPVVLPSGALPVIVPSAVVGNTQIQLTMPVVSGWWNVITGLTCGNNGATSAGAVVATITGVLGGTESFIIGVPASATTGQGQVDVSAGAFSSRGIPATAKDTAIVFTLPALGAGNTSAACTIYGYRSPANF